MRRDRASAAPYSVIPRTLSVFSNCTIRIIRLVPFCSAGRVLLAAAKLRAASRKVQHDTQGGTAGGTCDPASALVLKMGNGDGVVVEEGPAAGRVWLRYDYLLPATTASKISFYYCWGCPILPPYYYAAAGALPEKQRLPPRYRAAALAGKLGTPCRSARLLRGAGTADARGHHHPSKAKALLWFLLLLLFQLARRQ